MKDVTIWFLMVSAVLGVTPAWGVSLTDYGAVGDGVSDTTSAFNAAVSAACAAQNTRTLLIPPGHFRFLSPPGPIPCALNLLGDGKAVSWLIRDFNGLGGYFLKWIGGQDNDGGGSIRDLSIHVSPTSSEGLAIWIVAHPDTNLDGIGNNPHGLLIDNVQIGRYSTRGGSWAYGIYLDGSQNPGPSTIGLRMVSLRNVSVAQAYVASYYLNQAIGSRLTMVDCFGPGPVVLDGGSQGTVVSSATCSVLAINGN